MSEPTTVNPFKAAKNINQKNKDIVFGYLRECQWLLPNQYYQISEMIGVTILLYAVSIEYRVVISPGALCKKEKDLNSKVVAKILIGEIVEVEEIYDQRCRISSPVLGWLSLTAKDGRIILQRSNVKSELMDTAIKEKTGRETKMKILKSITMLNDATLDHESMLEKADWNLRRATEAYYIAKYKYSSNEETTVNSVNNNESNINKERNAWNDAIEKRKTKVLILKLITTLNERTVNRILENSDWSLGRAVEAFYIVKYNYETKEHLSQKEKSNKSSTSNESNNDKSSVKKSGWWKSWKTFTKDNA
eukprot:489897_1